VATVTLPRILAVVTGDVRTITVSGSTVQDALDDLIAQYPQLRVHLWDESGAWRPHVICLVNGRNLRWASEEPGDLEPDALLTILQAVSGGFSTLR